MSTAWEGDIENGNVNGPSITLTNISGSVVANATDGKILATISRVIPRREGNGLSGTGTAVNGHTPCIVQGKREAADDQGDVFTDFDIQTDPGEGSAGGEGHTSGTGRFWIEVDRSLFRLQPGAV